MGVVVRYLRDGGIFENKIREGSHRRNRDGWWMENTGEFESLRSQPWSRLIPFYGHKRNFKLVISNVITIPQRKEKKKSRNENNQFGNL
jgi:hypothetical protein